VDGERKISTAREKIRVITGKSLKGEFCGVVVEVDGRIKAMNYMV